MTGSKVFHLHLVSDATGETIHSVSRACVAQFEDVEPVEHFWNMVRSDRQLDDALEEIARHPGIVVFTLVDDHLRRRLQEACAAMGVFSVSVLDPVLAGFAHYLGKESQRRPGHQHALNAEYFSRMEAMEFALSHDDGQSTWDLHLADVILVAVSRCSKTPTCLYLANRGLKAANVPYVPNCPLPAELDEVKSPLIVALTKDADRLVQIRRQRLLALNQPQGSTYIDPEIVKAEVAEARRFFSRRGWPVIDVTRRAIEETAAEILLLMSRREQAE
ncbi:MAG: kinase/pyrophosphorylase [Inquilinus sp.]|nr:kinase/pyrophosphorylase [Inquilinus sp.]